MTAGRVNCFINEFILLAVVLGYCAEFVKVKAHMCMTDEDNAACSMKIPHPVTYIDYFDLMSHTGHQLEDASNYYS